MDASKELWTRRALAGLLSPAAVVLFTASAARADDSSYRDVDLIPCVERSEIVSFDDENEAVGQHRVTRVEPIQPFLGDDLPGSEAVEESSPCDSEFTVNQGMADEWAMFLVTAVAESGFEGDVIDWFFGRRVVPILPRVYHAAWLRKNSLGLVDGSAVGGDRTVRWAAVLRLDAEGQPVAVVRSFGGVVSNGESRRIPSFRMMTNLDDDEAWELVVTDSRYAGELEIVLDPCGQDCLEVQQLHSAAWD